jgi:hypothetical protein
MPATQPDRPPRSSTLPAMSADLSGEITAIATAALAAFAVITAAFAFLAYRKQSQEVAILLKQSERDAGDRRKAQAAQIFIAAPADPERPAIPYAHNASNLPIYEAKFWYRGQYTLSGYENPTRQPATSARSSPARQKVPTSGMPTNGRLPTPSSRSATRRASTRSGCPMAPSKRTAARHATLLVRFTAADHATPQPANRPPSPAAQPCAASGKDAGDE